MLQLHETSELSDIIEEYSQTALTEDDKLLRDQCLVSNEEYSYPYISAVWSDASNIKTIKEHTQHSLKKTPKRRRPLLLLKKVEDRGYTCSSDETSN